MQGDTRRKVEDCIIQLLRRRSMLCRKQIRDRLWKYHGLRISDSELHNIMQSLWQAGVVLKDTGAREWHAVIRYKLNTPSIYVDSISTPEIVESAYSS